MTRSSSFGVEYLAPAELPVRSDAWWDGILGMAHFGARPLAGFSERVPVAQVTMASLVTAGGLCEIWHADAATSGGRLRSVHYRANDAVLFGCLSVPENGPPPGASKNTHSPLERATLRAYADIFAVLDATGYSQLVRIWNYVPSIIGDEGGEERYWQFNRARQKSFLAANRAIVDSVPAASAVGTPTGSALVIYFLAGRVPVRAIENPRQVSAYHYPSKYGPSSPTFSRAALLTEQHGDTLLVSGTASIVGHESAHADDVAAQTRESMANIGMLITEANRLNGRPCYSSDVLAYKVYVRNPEQLPTIAAELRAAVGDGAAVIYVHADVCRRELSVEIEAASSRRRTRSSGREDAAAAGSSN